MFKGVLGLGFVSSYTLYCGNNNDQASPHLYFHSKIIQRETIVSLRYQECSPFVTS